MLGVAIPHYVQTLTDTNKGSLTNRHQAAKEHFKNDLKFGYSIAIPTAAVTVAAMARPGLITKVATKSGTMAAKVLDKIATILPKKVTSLKDGITKLANTIMKNPKKAGLIGLGIVGVSYLLNRGAKYANKAGRIDQKYEDAAKIESQTKNVVLEGKNEKAVETIKPNFFTA